MKTNFLNLMMTLMLSNALANVDDSKIDANTNNGSDRAKSVMQSVVDRYQGKSRVSSMSLITCQYELVDGRIRCQSEKRKKLLQSFVKNYGDQLKDTKGFTHILHPLSEKGISILQYDYEEVSKDTDQWLYLPELQKVKRIASDGSAPKKGSLFGSEFSMEDIERMKLDEYNYQLIDEKKIKERNIVILELTPNEKRASKTNYSKQVLWVDTDKSLVIKTEYYAWDSSLIKVRQAGAIRKVNDIWTIGKEVMRNRETKRISELLYKDITYNIEIEDDMLTQRVLVDPIFRKSMLDAVSVEVSLVD